MQREPLQFHQCTSVVISRLKLHRAKIIIQFGTVFYDGKYKHLLTQIHTYMKAHILVPVKKNFNKVALFIAMLLVSFYSFAQEKKVEIDINTKSENSNFFMQPWVWIAGGAVFILLLVALLRPSKK